jgi:hypothetical protein
MEVISEVVPGVNLYSAYMHLNLGMEPYRSAWRSLAEDPHGQMDEKEIIRFLRFAKRK